MPISLPAILNTELWGGLNSGSATVLELFTEIAKDGSV